LIARRWQVNGSWREVRVLPLEPLLRVLRERLGVTGPKEGCGEGECGACTVLLNGEPVTACLVAAGAVPEGSAILTAEGIAELELGRLITDCLIDHGAVQCGICFPGMLVAVYAYLRDAREVSAAAAREAISGNLCRCTGYRRIVQATLAAAREAATRDRDWRAQEALSGGAGILAPETLADALAHRARHPGALVLAGGTDLMVQRAARRSEPLTGRASTPATLPAAPTASGATGAPGSPDSAGAPDASVLFLGAIAQLRGVEQAQGDLLIGATTSVEALARDALVARLAPALAQAAGRLGARAIRQLATLGGNLVNASPAADLVPPLLAAEAFVQLISRRGVREVPLRAFYLGYKQVDLRPDELLARIRVPGLRAGETEGFRKLGTRRAQAIAKVCAAVRVRVEAGSIARVAIALGSVAPTAVRLPQTEARLIGCSFSETLRPQIYAWTAGEIAPISDLRSTVEYRSRAAGVLVADLLDELTRPATAE
jgi:xanthine dehydrogenase iron-sulfur cluster and FAD-binding subunit A